MLTISSPAWAQEVSDDPPEILSSELALKTILESDELEATLVIVDTDNVTAVTINGESMPIEPGDTVQITRTFVFKQDVTRLEVTATDEKGHTRKVVYTVFRPGVDPTQVAEGPKEEKLRWFASYNVRMQSDSNPSNDLSLPISLPDVPELGVVPDSEQTDTRTNIALSGGISKGNYAGYAGLARIDYGKAANDRFNLMAIYLGGSALFPLSQDYGFRFAYTFLDVNLGNSDYNQSHALSPALRVTGDDGKGGTTTTLWGLDLISKNFASDTQAGATDLIFKWQMTRVRANKLDRYKRLISLGKSSEGTAESEYSFMSFDYDWNNQWESGLKWDIGYGFAFRQYPNDVPLADLLGSVRADLPIRFSTGIGWQFNPHLRVMGTYNTQFYLSNTTPYSRNIIGVGVDGSF